MRLEADEQDVVATVVSSRNSSNQQHSDDIDEAVPVQHDEILAPGNETSPSNDDDGSERRERCDLVEDCRDSSYFCSHKIGDAYDVNEPSTCNQCSEDETNYNNSNCSESCEPNDEITPVDHYKNYVHRYQNQHINCEDDNHNKCIEKSKYIVYPEDHTYKKKDKSSLNRETHVEPNHGYYTADKTINQTRGPSTLHGEYHINTYRESKNTPQMEDCPVDNRELCQKLNYKYLKDYNNVCQGEDNCPDNTEVCVVREYVYHGGDNVLQRERSRGPYHNGYYGCELQNEKIDQEEAADPVMQQPSQDQSHMYQEADSRSYNREETITTDREDRGYSYLNDNDSSGNKTYIMRINDEHYDESNFQNKEVFHENSTVLETDENKYITENECTFQRLEPAAVDLRILRPLSYSPSSVELQPSYNMQELTNVSQVSDGFCLVDNSKETVSISETAYEQGIYSSKQSYLVPHRHSQVDEPGNCPQHQINNETFDCIIYETTNVDNRSLWDAATNTDHTKVEDKECQTGIREVQDVAVQTDIQSNFLPFAFLKNIQKEIVKHSCPICQRVYISKSSFDRHLRTHEKGKNNNVIANVRFTTEAKLQICKRAGKNKLLKADKPIIIQLPRSIFQCDVCDKIFPNQREKDNHDCSFKPFPLTKCPECHIKFYTPGALNEHIGIVHKKENAYYCIFCNKSFNAGYNFHLHLDEHLSAP